MSGPRLGVLIDYQNIHLTARDVFAPPGTTARATLIHPLRLPSNFWPCARAPNQTPGSKRRN